MAEGKIDQFLRLIEEYGAESYDVPNLWKLKYRAEINEDDVRKFDSSDVEYLANYRLKNSLMYSDLISNTLLSTNNISLFDSCDNYFKHILYFKIFGCIQDKVPVKFIEEIDTSTMDQFSLLYKIINENKSEYSDFLLVPTSVFTAVYFREKVLYNHMCHGNKKISNLINKNNFYDYKKSFYDFTLGWDIDSGKYVIYKMLYGGLEEKIAVAKLSSKNLNTVGTLSQITDFVLTSDTNHDNLDDDTEIDIKKKKNNKLLKYMILSQFMNKN